MKQIFEFVQRQMARGFALIALLAVMMVPALAQQESADPPTERGWQTVITNQIEAFRAGDAGAALELAGSGFKQTYDNPERFMSDVLSWGYEPILQSVSHSFGEFRPGGEGVILQIVQVIGSDQGYYEAMYQMHYEDGGWRILGVAMGPKTGVGI